MRKKKIIILYSTSGMGHKKAAFSLLDEFQARGEEASVKIIDVLNYGDSLFKFLYLDFYVFLMLRAKWLWGLLYYFSDFFLVDILTRPLCNLSSYSGLKRLITILNKENPDAIIATHFILANLGALLKKNKNFKSKLYVVITDYGPHNWWLSKHIDRFFVGANKVLDELKKRSFSPAKVSVTGIPTAKEFCTSFNTSVLSAAYGLEENRRTIFIMGGGFGVGPINKILSSLVLCKSSIQVILVCGHNQALYDSLQSLKSTLKFPILLFGFTEKVAELMSISNLMITKAGGISTTEAVNMRLPMILYASLPGQETWNEAFLVKEKAAYKAQSLREVPLLVDEIFSNQNIYEELRSNIERIRKTDAAKSIIDIVLGEI